MKIKTIISFGKQILRLNPEEKSVFIRTVIVAMVIHLALKIWSFKAVIKFLESFKSTTTDKKNEFRSVKLYHKILNINAKLNTYLFNCLSLSIAFWFLFKRIGINTNLKFGNLKNGDKLIGHAWLVYQGICLTIHPLIEEKYEDFRVTIL